MYVAGDMSSNVAVSERSLVSLSASCVYTYAGCYYFVWLPLAALLFRGAGISVLGHSKYFISRNQLSRFMKS